MLRPQLDVEVPAPSWSTRSSATAGRRLKPQAPRAHDRDAHTEGRCIVEVRLVGTRAVADAFGISADTVTRLAKRGDIPHVRVTERLFRFNLDEVRGALDRRRQALLEHGAESVTA
jgi:excisionase family DNA binding protein